MGHGFTDLAILAEMQSGDDAVEAAALSQFVERDLVSRNKLGQAIGRQLADDGVTGRIGRMAGDRNRRVERRTDLRRARSRCVPPL